MSVRPLSPILNLAFRVYGCRRTMPLDGYHENPHTHAEPENYFVIPTHRLRDVSGKLSTNTMSTSGEMVIHRR